MKEGKLPSIPSIIFRILSSEEYQEMATHQQSQMDEMLAEYKARKRIAPAGGPAASFKPSQKQGNEKILPKAGAAQNGPAAPPEKPKTVIPSEMIALKEKMEDRLENIPERAKILFLSLMRHTAEDSPRMVCPGEYKEEILRECGWVNKVALYRGLKILCGCFAIRKTGFGEYEIGPRYESLIADVQALKAEESSVIYPDTEAAASNKVPVQDEPETPSDGASEQEAGVSEFDEDTIDSFIKRRLVERNAVSASAEDEITSVHDGRGEMTCRDEAAPQIAPERFPGVPERWIPLLSSLRRLAGDGQEADIGLFEGGDPYLGCGDKATMYQGFRALSDCKAIRSLGWGRFLLLDAPARVPANDVNSEGSAREDPAPASLINNDEPSQSLTETLISKETSEETECPQPESAGKNPDKEPVPGRWKRLYEGLRRKTGDNGLVHTGGSAASELAIECGWNSKSSVFVGLRALCGCGAIEKIENGIYRIAADSANPGDSGDASISNETPMPSGEIQEYAAPALHEADEEENILCSGKESGRGEGVPGRWKNLILALSHRAENGLVKTGGAVADEIMRECGWSNKVSIYEGLSELCSCGALRKLGKGKYQIAYSFPDGRQPAEVQVPKEDPAADKQVPVCRFIPNRWRLLFSVLCKKSEGEIVLTSGSAVGEITTKCGWTNQNTVYAGLSALCKCGAISMLEKGRYRINPHTPGLENPPEKRTRDGSGLMPGGGAVALKGSFQGYTSTAQEAAFKQSVLAALRKYRAENGLGCYNTLAKKAGVPVDYIRSMMESGRVSFSYWKNVGKELGVEWGEK